MVIVVGADGCVGGALGEQARARRLDRFRPDVVIFAAAFTPVDELGRDPRARAIKGEVRIGRR